MEKIKKLNLAIASFVRELNSYIENVNEIDDETIKLLTDTTVVIEKLQINSKYRNNENTLLNAVDVEEHEQKESHHDEVVDLQSSRDFNRNFLFHATSNATLNTIKKADHSSGVESNNTRQQDSSSSSVDDLFHSASSSLSIHENTSKAAPAESVNNGSNSNLKSIASTSSKNTADESNASKLLVIQNLKSTLSELQKKSSGEFDEAKNQSNTSAPANNTDTNNVAISRSTAAEKLEDIINVREVSKMTKVEMDQILAISMSRMNSEQEIINTLSVFLKERYSIQTVAPFGSVTYGFGGPKTNLNILIIKGKSVSTFDTLLTSLENAVKHQTLLQQEFGFQCRLKANRVRKEQLQIVHRKSQIQCVLQFGTESDLQRSQQTMKIIMDYIRLHPMCKLLIAFVRGWQNVLNEVAAKNGLEAFHFNTYIISVLVIFYLQLTHKLPAIKNLTSNNTVFLSTGDLGQFIKKFFYFYGTYYESDDHLISINAGKWQQVKPPDQVRAMGQKSNRNGVNWSDGSMYVQDVVSAWSNITVEIPKREVDNFVKMCRMFSKYMHKLRIEGFSLTISAYNAYNKMADPNQRDDVVQLIERKIAEDKLPSHLEARRSSEIEITYILSQYIRSIDPSWNIHPCGSTQYGIELLNADFNLLVTTSDADSVDQDLYSKLENMYTSDHFKDLRKIGANRVTEEHISITHIKSGIQCTLLFGKDHTIVESTELLYRFTKDPLCNSLIKFIKTWQTVLNEMDIACFEFNTYIVSILVIFFLQMEFGDDSFPTVDQLLQTDASVHSNESDFRQMLRHFFYFYGYRYQTLNRVISINFGRWQERRLQSIQKNFKPAQKKLREGIEASPENWSNCTMFVQDILRPEINVTAEIPEKAAEKFQEMCQEFAKRI